MDKRVSISVLSGLTFLLVFNTVSAQYQGYKPVNDIANFKKNIRNRISKGYVDHQRFYTGQDPDGID